MNENSLSSLKPLHLPNAVSIFPLAIGWYLLLALIIIGIIITISYFVLRQKKLKKQVYQLLAEIQNHATPDNHNQVIAQVSILLKRVARLKFPKHKPENLFGEDWLIFLDKTGATKDFTKGSGRVLLNIYKNNSMINTNELFALTRKWLGRVL